MKKLKRFIKQVFMAYLLIYGSIWFVFLSSSCENVESKEQSERRLSALLGPANISYLCEIILIKNGGSLLSDEDCYKLFEENISAYLELVNAEISEIWLDRRFFMSSDSEDVMRGVLKYNLKNGLTFFVRVDVEPDLANRAFELSYDEFEPWVFEPCRKITLGKAKEK